MIINIVMEPVPLTQAQIDHILDTVKNDHQTYEYDVLLERDLRLCRLVPNGTAFTDFTNRIVQNFGQLRPMSSVELDAHHRRMAKPISETEMNKMKTFFGLC